MQFVHKKLSVTRYVESHCFASISVRESVIKNLIVLRNSNNEKSYLIRQTNNGHDSSLDASKNVRSKWPVNICVKSCVIMDLNVTRVSVKQL